LSHILNPFLFLLLLLLLFRWGHTNFAQADLGLQVCPTSPHNIIKNPSLNACIVHYLL
jgi:hypothetical protein